MAKLSYKELAAVVSDYIVANKIASGTFTAVATDTAGLIDKIGKIITVDTSFVDKLGFMDGDELTYGKTIEEWQQDLVLPVAYDSDGADALAPYDPTFRPVAYSYSLGRKIIPTTIRQNDMERAVNNASELANLVAMKTKRLADSEAAFRYDAKREILAKYAAACIAAHSTVTPFSTNIHYPVNTYLVNQSGGSVYGVVVKDISDTSALTWSTAVSGGYIIVLDLVETLAAPTDTETGEAFIESVQKACEVAGDMNEGHSLNGNSLGATEGLVLVIKQGIKAVLDTQVLAGAFNPEKLGIPCEVVVVKDFGSDTNGVYGILMDKRGAKMHNDFRAVFEQFNGKGGFSNLFLHTENTAYYSRNTFIKVYKAS